MRINLANQSGSINQPTRAMRSKEKSCLNRHQRLLTHSQTVDLEEVFMELK